MADERSSGGAGCLAWFIIAILWLASMATDEQIEKLEARITALEQAAK